MLGQVSYGPGQSCPSAPPPPDGYRVWNESTDGPVPSAVAQLAGKLAFSSYPLGYFETAMVGTTPIIVRVDPHSWSHNTQGVLITGCFHGATAYKPTGLARTNLASAPQRQSVGLTIVEVLIVGGTLFGTAFTVGKSMFENKHQREAVEDDVRQKVRQRLTNGSARRNPVRPVPGGAPLPWFRASWPVYEVKIASSRSGRHAWDIIELERRPGEYPSSRIVGSERNRNEALYKAGALVNAYVQQNPRNPNPARVLDEKGHCVYAAQGVDQAGQPEVLPC